MPGGRQSPDGNRQRAQHARLGGGSRIPGYFHHFKKKPLSSSQRFIEKMLEASSVRVGTLSSQDKGEKNIILKFIFFSY